MKPSTKKMIQHVLVGLAAIAFSILMGVCWHMPRYPIGLAGGFWAFYALGRWLQERADREQLDQFRSACSMSAFAANETIGHFEIKLKLAEEVAVSAQELMKLVYPRDVFPPQSDNPDRDVGAAAAGAVNAALIRWEAGTDYERMLKQLKKKLG